jgi:hypothetical protein
VINPWPQPSKKNVEAAEITIDKLETNISHLTSGSTIDALVDK